MILKNLFEFRFGFIIESEFLPCLKGFINNPAERYFIETRANTESIRGRLIEREKAGKAVSDGRWEIFERFKKDFQEPDELPKGKYLVVPTDKNIGDTLIQVLIRVAKPLNLCFFKLPIAFFRENSHYRKKLQRLSVRGL